MAQDKPRGLGPQYQKFSPDDFPEEPSPGSNEMSLEEPVYSEPGRERVGENVCTIGNGMTPRIFQKERLID
ncbi:hypothetical protein CISG_08087 [Coccidioides immitis RMSCC 3703]|uniref:Uncharacterized protein n=2 Tax=Coccidioides immitis TaxID=5501 RepID=A0A0J8U0M3_COCIT|nr:hypothetical protein CIRG_02223 [Coccidioides immitis RMSCC 2394]KMU79807.1 hypothetical protein CISG_08087 [Coccidioides immitis RMSCC 3703]